MAKGIKTGGRIKGTQNKLTFEMRNVLKTVIAEEIEGLPELLQKIEDPERRIYLLIKLMPYVFPKVQPVSQSQDEPFRMNW